MTSLQRAGIGFGGAAGTLGLGRLLAGGGPFHLPTPPPANPITNDVAPPDTSGLLNTLGGAGGVAQLGGGAINIAEGHPLQGSIQAASGAVNLANALGANIPFAGPALGLANIGASLASGSEQGDRQAVRAIMSMAFPGSELVFGATDLINGLIGEGEGAGISKRIMHAKQQALQQGATAATMTMLDKAQNFSQVMDTLRMLPAGTGQVQYGVGAEYTGETQQGSSDLTTTPGWDRAVLEGSQDPTTFVKNFWVQTGEGGATSFDPIVTRQYQMAMLKSLPPTPELVQFTQLLQNTEPVDPRNTQAFQRAFTEAQTWQAMGAQGLSPYQRRFLTQQYQGGLEQFQQTQDPGLMAGLRGQAQQLGLPIPANLQPSTVQQALMLGLAPTPPTPDTSFGFDPNAFSVGGG